MDEEPELRDTGDAMNVEIIKLTPVGNGNLKVFVSVDIGGKLKVYSCRIIQQADQRPLVSLPTQEWTDREGKKRYSPIIELPDQVKDAVEDAILKYWERQQ